MQTSIQPAAVGGGAGDALDGDSESTAQYVTFALEQEVFGFPLKSVLEIIRVPEAVSVPLAPSSLVGLANLRGTVLPVMDLRRALSLPEVPYTEATRVVVTDVGTPVGMVVDRVARVLSVDQAQVESSAAVQSTIRAELMTGVVKDQGQNGLIQLLDVARCVSLQFAHMVRDSASSNDASSGQMRRALESAESEAEDDALQIVSFIVDGQEYGFSIAQVEEIVRVPENISRVPRADSSVIGLINLRNRLLPLVSMRRVFALPERALDETDRILVVTLSRHGGRAESVGIVVDHVRAVMRIDRDSQDKMPALLSRKGSANQIQTVCRLDGGKRLISVLNEQALFAHEAVRSAVESAQQEGVQSTMQSEGQALDTQTDDDEDKLVVFLLDDQEFGVIVESVQEIIRVPEEMSRVPKTPAFIEGMVNLRGAVLPVIDMRTRFGLARSERNDRQRILVLNQAGTCTGFIVDSVSEVLGLSRSVIENTPHLSDDQARIMGRVANMKQEKRMIQILDARQLMSDDELAQVVRASNAPGPRAAAAR